MNHIKKTTLEDVVPMLLDRHPIGTTLTNDTFGEWAVAHGILAPEDAHAHRAAFTIARNKLRERINEVMLSFNWTAIDRNKPCSINMVDGVLHIDDELSTMRNNRVSREKAMMNQCIRQEEKAVALYAATVEAGAPFEVLQKLLSSMVEAKSELVDRKQLTAANEAKRALSVEAGRELSRLMTENTDQQ